jgi:hypothetical protein
MSNSVCVPDQGALEASFREHGLTNSDVARLLHVSENTVSGWLAISDSPSFKKMPTGLYELLIIKLDIHPVYATLKVSAERTTSYPALN